jgi:hypothetical protein
MSRAVATGCGVDFLMNTSDTTCGNQTETLLNQAAMPPSFAVRARKGGRTDSNRAAPAVASASQVATKLPFQPSAHARHGPGPLHTMTSP